MIRVHHLQSLALAVGLASAGLGVSSLVAPQVAAAQSGTQELNVHVIVGSNNGQGVDGSLRAYSSQLNSQFSSFNSFSLSDRETLRLNVGQSGSVSLPGGGRASFRVVSISGGRVELEMQVPGGSSTLTIQSRGGRFFTGGASIPGGTLILMVET